MNRCFILSNFYQDVSTSRPNLIYNYFKNICYTEVLTSDFIHSERIYNKKNLTGIKRFHVNKYGKNFSIKRIFSHITFAFKVSFYLKKVLNKNDVVYICLPPNFMAYLVARISRHKNAFLVIDVIDIWPNYKIKGDNVFFLFFKFWANLRTKAIELANVVILECNLYKKYLVENGENCFNIIPLAKKESINFKQDFNLIKKDIFYVCYLGAFSHSYDFDSLINILKNVKTKNIHLEIIGEGEQKDVFLLNLRKNNIAYTDYGIVYDELYKAKILSKCCLGFNGFVDDAIVGLSYKSIDYLSFGVPLINNLKLDTWELVDKYKIGFNYVKINSLEIANNIDKTSMKDFIEMKKRARIIFDKDYSYIAFKKKLDNLILKKWSLINETFDDNF